MKSVSTILTLKTALLLLVCLACGAPADPAELITADRQFSADVQAGGSDAWASWFAEDGAIVREGAGEIRGREEIRRVSGFLDDPAVSLVWEPARSDISASGDLGWTTGPYTLQMTNPDGVTTTSTGVYVSIWRRQPDGTWKVVMDLGNPA